MEATFTCRRRSSEYVLGSRCARAHEWTAVPVRPEHHRGSGQGVVDPVEDESFGERPVLLLLVIAACWPSWNARPSANLLGDFGREYVLHEQLTHLTAQRLHALVVPPE